MAKKRGGVPITADNLKSMALRVIAAVNYDSSLERVRDVLAACETWSQEIINKGSNGDENVVHAKTLLRRVSDAKTLLRTSNPERAMAIMFDIGMLAQWLRVRIDVPAENRIAMTLTEAARRLGYTRSRKQDDAGRKQVEREIAAGILNARRLSARSRKWWFDRRQIPAG